MILVTFFSHLWFLETNRRTGSYICKCRLWFGIDKNTLSPKRCQISLQITFTANIINPTIMDYINESNKLTTQTLKFHGWAGKATHFDEMKAEFCSMLQLLWHFQKEIQQPSSRSDPHPSVQNIHTFSDFLKPISCVKGLSTWLHKL